MTDNPSHVDSADESDNQFEELIQNMDFWKVVVKKTPLRSTLTEDELLAYCHELASDSVRIFELAFKRKLPIDEIVKHGFGRNWTKKSVRQMCVLLSLLPQTQEGSSMTTAFKTYHPRLQAMLKKAERGETLTSQERATLLANAGVRAVRGLPLHPVQEKVLKEEMRGLSSAEQRAKAKQAALDVINAALGDSGN